MTIIHFIKPLQIFIFITFIMVLMNFDKQKKTDVILFCIVALAVANEFVSALFHYLGIPIGFSTTIYVVISNVLWFYMIYEVCDRQQATVVMLYVFISFALYEFVFVDGTSKFSSYTFVVGSLLYVVLFIVDSSIELKQENLSHFMSNNFILISAPVLFFIGFSLIFGFKEKETGRMLVFNSFTVYDFISYFVNIVYYSLINFYIYREKKIKYAV